MGRIVGTGGLDRRREEEMNLHEFQAKEILARYGIAIPPGGVAWTAAEAEAVAGDLGAKRMAVKAQVHAGGRGRAGGVRIASNVKQVRDIAAALLGTRLVTDQTGPEGSLVRRVYVEAAIDIDRDLYLAALVDRQSGRVALIGARQGGDDIEDRAARDPKAIEKLLIDPGEGAAAADYPGFARRLALEGTRADKAATLFAAVARAFVDLDASLIEINPLAVSASSGDLMALDAKMVIDDNALFRHQDLAALRDEDDLDEVELEAQRHEINFIRMDGDIGVVVNGAGLALASLDMLVDAGGKPANFMDIRTTATSLQISRGLDLVLENPAVKVLLVNVHGGGMTPCDIVAEAIGISARRTGRRIPTVVRFAGNSADYALQILRNLGTKFAEAATMGEAVERAVRLARGEAA
jgi:succinyl-CoA synthetase beta subunit